MARPGISQHSQFDVLLELHDGAAAVTSDGAGQVGGSAAIVDLYQGASSGSAGVGAEFKGEWVIDVSAIDQTTGDELVTLILEVSPDSDFGTAGNIQHVVMIQLGDEDTMHGATGADRLTGRYVIPFSNEVNGTTYRYVRMYFDVNGTSPSITCTSRLNKAA